MKLLPRMWMLDIMVPRQHTLMHFWWVLTSYSDIIIEGEM